MLYYFFFGATVVLVGAAGITLEVATVCFIGTACFTGAFVGTQIETYFNLNAYLPSLELALPVHLLF